VHWVEFQRGFWMAKTEVTNEEYEAFAPELKRTSLSPEDRDPVVKISWRDARKYCTWLSKRTGLPIRLPSESEWECACRAGSRREFTFGNDATLLARYAWYEANSDGHAHQVGTLPANRWGFHDLHGNVREWCEDTWHESYENAPADGTAWTEGDSPHCVGRGGAWDFTAEESRSAARFWYHTWLGIRVIGFRPAFLPAE
jgi:formylglycine-generating enzyme required for sulfatase activity